MYPSQNKYKVVVLGNINVGKTSLVSYYVMGTFCQSYKPTVGIDFLSKTIYLEDSVVRLQIWDTAGQERFRSLIPGYVRDSSAAIVVYDVTDTESFEQLPYWIELVKKEKEMALAIVGNKVDLAEKRLITTEEGKKISSDYKALFFETSAKYGENIEQLFEAIVKSVIYTVPVNYVPVDDNLSHLDLKPMPISDESRYNCRC